MPDEFDWIKSGLSGKVFLPVHGRVFVIVHGYVAGILWVIVLIKSVRYGVAFCHKWL